MNLFKTLMPSRPGAMSTSKQPRSFGREDYITAAVALVLQADTAAGGKLVEYMLDELYGIELHAAARATAQARHENKGSGVSYIDLEIRTDADLVLLENKTGTGIGARLIRETGEEIDQLAKYSQVLDHAPVPAAHRHIGMLVWSPQPARHSLYFRGARYWWDLYDVLIEAPVTGEAYADRLRAELLTFFQFVELDPIRPLRAADLTNVSVCQRLLARSISFAIQEGTDLVNPRPATTGAYLFELATSEGREAWMFGFSAGALVARVSNDGYRQVSLPAGFFSATDVETQVRDLAEILRTLHTAPREPSRSSLPEEAFLAGFGDVRPVVEALFERCRDVGWSLRIGSAEGVLQRWGRSPSIVVYVSAAYSSGPCVRIWCSSTELRDQVARELAAAHGPQNVKAGGESVQLLLGPSTAVGDLLAALEALDPTLRPELRG